MTTQKTEITIATNDQIEQAFAIRQQVFIEEQNVPEDLERDGLDDDCTHFLIWVNGVAVGTGRCRTVNSDTIKFERMALLGKYRNQGFGTQLLQAMITFAREKNFQTIRLHAQSEAVPYYRRAGFEVTGDQFLEAGIVHLPMKLTL